jgi:hypothetical protein
LPALDRDSATLYGQLENTSEGVNEHMIKAAIIVGALLLLAGVSTAGTLTGLGSSDDSPTVSIPDDSVSIEDETISTGTTVEDQTISTETGGDISGPCDEAEHAADPRCTGAVGTTTDRVDDDRRRRGRDRRGDDRDEDRSGSNRGSGRGDDRGGDDSGRGGNSGRGGGHDD